MTQLDSVIHGERLVLEAEYLRHVIDAILQTHEAGGLLHVNSSARETADGWVTDVTLSLRSDLFSPRLDRGEGASSE